VNSPSIGRNIYYSARHLTAILACLASHKMCKSFKLRARKQLES